MKSHDQEMNKQGGGKGSEMEHLYPHPHESAEKMKTKRKPEDRPSMEKIEEEDGATKSG